MYDSGDAYYNCIFHWKKLTNFLDGHKARKQFMNGMLQILSQLCLDLLKSARCLSDTPSRAQKFTLTIKKPNVSV